jgi:hypothetical protein
VRGYNKKIRGESWAATEHMFGSVWYLNSYAGFVRDLLRPTPREIPEEFTESEGEPEEPTSEGEEAGSADAEDVSPSNVPVPVDVLSPTSEGEGEEAAAEKDDMVDVSIADAEQEMDNYLPHRPLAGAGGS